ADAEVLAVGGAVVGAAGPAQVDLAVDLVVELRPAQLPARPQAVAGLPAEVAAEAGVGLAEVAAALAEVDVLAAVADEAAVHHAAAAPADAEGAGRADAVETGRLVVALLVAAHVGPPVGAVVGAGRLRGAIGHLRAGAADGGRRTRQRRDDARAIDHRDRVLRQQLVRRRGRVDAVGEGIGIGAARHRGQRTADQRGRHAHAGHAGRVGQAVGRWRVGDLADEVEGIDRDHV